MATLSDLTLREKEILQLVLLGWTNKTIGAAMCISDKTVEFHLDKIYTKIGLRSRMLVSMWAIQKGMRTGPRKIPAWK